MIIKKKFILFLISFNILIILVDLFHLVSTSNLVITLESFLCFSILLVLIKSVFLKMYFKGSYSISFNYKNVYIYCKNLYMNMLNFYKIFLNNFKILLNVFIISTIKTKKLYLILFLKFYFFFNNKFKYKKIFLFNFLLTNFL